MPKKKNKSWGPPFVMLEKRVLRSKEWQGLTSAARDIYILIKANYNGRNNSEIPFKYSEAEGMYAPATISRALKKLIDEGWIKKTQHGGLHRYYCLYEITWKYDVKRGGK